MSRYEWEQGEIVIPANQWAKFRTELLRKWNTTQTANWELAKKAHKAAKEAAKGKRGQNRTDAILNSLAKSAGGSVDEWGYFKAPTIRVGGYWTSVQTPDTAAEERWEMLTRHCLTVTTRTTTLSKTQPQKKAFDIKPLSKSASFNCDDAHISLNNENNIVIWHVSENNHACDYAHDWWFAKALFKALSKVKWTRNSGGSIIGNDEYNRDSYEMGGGANYVKQVWGLTR